MELTPFSHVFLCLQRVVLCFWLRWVVLGHPTLTLSFALRLGGAFPLLQIRRSKVSLLLVKLLLDLDSVSVRCAERGDVQELYLILDLPM